MNRLHVKGLPPEVTDEHLRVLFAQFGPVMSAMIVRNLEGQSLGLGMVEMRYAEDVQEILTSPDRLTIGGKRPHIWKPNLSIADLIRSKNNGVHIKPCKDRWYVFEMDYGQLRWCWAFPTEAEAVQFRKLHVQGSSTA